MSFLIEFRVKGKGYFPMDMLRYSKCEPRTEDDEESILATPSDWPGEREIELVRMASNTTAVNFLADDRWKSFGWEIIARRKHYHVPTEEVNRYFGKRLSKFFPQLFTQKTVDEFRKSDKV